MQIIRINKKVLFFLLTFILNETFFCQVNFTPNNLPGLKLWLTGDSCYSSNLSNIDTIYDLSLNKNHASQTNISLKPIFSGNQYNGHKTLLFDGNDDFAAFNPINDIRTVFWVLKENTSSPNDRPLLGHSSLYDFHRGYNNIMYHSTFTHTFILTGQTRLNFLAVNGETQQMPNTFNVVSLVTTGNVNAEFFSKDRLNTSRVWFGELAELIIYNQALSSSEVLQVEEYLNNKYAPPVQLPLDISVSKSFCDTVIIPINPLGNQYNYLWSTGATTQTISVNQSGKYWVDAINNFGKLSSDTILVNFPQLNQRPDTTFCFGNTIFWDTEFNKTDYSFQWQDNSTDSAFNISQTGNYYVKITDSYGCSITSDTAKILVDNFANNVSLGPDVSLCSGNLITLANGASPSLTYTWSNGSTNDSLLINTTGQYSVVVTNTNNCVARDTINVTIQGLAPIANFSASVGCQNTAVSFTNLSSPPSGNTITASNWNFGNPASPSNTSTVTNPFHTFSDTGTYTVRLNVVTDLGCEQAITKTIHIAPNPTVNFSIGNSCQNDSTAFSNQSTSVAGYSITALNWNFGDPVSGSLNTSGATNPKHVFGSQSNYTVSLTATNNAGCSTTLNNIIAVKAEVKADFTYSTPCTNTTTVFQDNSIASSTAANTRFWNFGTSTSPGLTVPKTYTVTGPYNVSLTVSVNGCTSSISKIITIFSPPLVSFTIPAFCSKDTITAINSSVAQSGVISIYNWRLNNNSFASVQNPTLSLISAGNYPVRLTVVNSFGCKDSLTKTITVNPLPIVDFTTNPANYYYINEPIGFIPSITTAYSYSWNVSGVMTSTLQNPSVSINSEGTYTASLNLQDQQGCKNSKSKIILVSKRYLDLALLNITTIKDDDGFMTVVTDIANYGTVPATTINLQYQISDGGNNIETWNGILNPNSFYTYTFNSKSASQANSTNNITCVSIKKVNGLDDENPNNNDLCSALYYDEVSVSNPFPNPTAENITLPIILNKDIDYTMSIYNSTGQMLLEETTQNGILGLNLVSIPTSSYAWGCYILKVVIDDKVFIKKFIKVNN